MVITSLARPDPTLDAQMNVLWSGHLDYNDPHHRPPGHWGRPPPVLESSYSKVWLVRQVSINRQTVI
ncbi:hypothetical protein Bca4012_021481 [Brassica carinata]